MTWGRSALALRTSQPLTVSSAQKEARILPPGEYIFKLLQGSPALRENWIWIGNSRQDTLQDWMTKLIEVQPLELCFWPVGLAPWSDDWPARGYRILLRWKGAEPSTAESDAYIKSLLPDQQGVRIDLPVGRQAGEVTLIQSEGAPLNLALPIRLTCDSVIEALEAPVGEGFHWEHTETLQWPSPVWLDLGSDGRLCAGVETDIEDYLASVNSSEMPADSPLEFLKSQVVAARSWLLATWGSHHAGEPYIVCNGDHCQCYYGADRIAEASRQAMESTRGEALMVGESICDARYAKSCGGVTEPGANIWDFVDEPYLTHLRDLPGAESSDLSNEATLREFQQRTDPKDACCSPGYAALKGKLADLAKLYRWEVSYRPDELGRLIAVKTGWEAGAIQEMKPLRRGPSGRLIELEIIGERGTLRLTPELAIRRALSPTHLPSSAFWIEWKSGDKIVLHGLGWGHGAGMCQIGAAALAQKGWDYQSILTHYYPNTSIKKIY
jgi:stage II sporulation protein D